MLLVLRDGMARLGVLAPIPAERSERRRAFVDALLAGILPFVAFYAAWGYLREDAAAYFARLLEVNTGLIADEILGEVERAGDACGRRAQSRAGDDRPSSSLAFAGRWLWKRYRSRLPKAFAAIAVYLEVLWVYLSVTLIADALNIVVDVGRSHRQAMVWLGDVREWVGDQLVPVAWVWDAVEWLLGEVGGIVLLPIAWLTIAGRDLRAGGRPSDRAPRRRMSCMRAQARFDTLPSRLRARLRDLWSDLDLAVPADRPRAAADVARRTGARRLVHPAVHDRAGAGCRARVRRSPGSSARRSSAGSGWSMPRSSSSFVPLVIEPLRVVLVASAYDAVIGRLAPIATGAAEVAEDLADEAGAR